MKHDRVKVVIMQLRMLPNTDYTDKWLISFVCTLPSTIAPLLSKFLYFQIASSQTETVFPINACLRRWHKYEIAAKTFVHLKKKKKKILTHPVHATPIESSDINC